MIVIIPFTSSKQFFRLEEKLAKDQVHLQAGADYINAKYNHAPYERIESVLLTAFSNHPFLTMPKLDSPRADAYTNCVVMNRQQRPSTTLK